MSSNKSYASDQGANRRALFNPCMSACLKSNIARVYGLSFGSVMASLHRVGAMVASSYRSDNMTVYNQVRNVSKYEIKEVLRSTSVVQMRWCIYYLS